MSGALHIPFIPFSLVALLVQRRRLRSTKPTPVPTDAGAHARQ